MISTKFGILLAVSIVILLVVIAMIFSSNSSSTLKGTFANSELPFTTMVFDLNDNQTFYFYTEDETDKGSYEKVSDSKYIINSSTFTDQEVTYDENKGVEIEMNDQIYLFTNTSDSPTHIIND